MDVLRQASYRYPILLFLLIAFSWTWAFWFGSLLFDDNWAIRKIIAGMGFGPAMAAILLSSLRGRRCVVHSLKWWSWYSLSFFMLLVSYVSMLVTGDGLTAHDFKLAQPPWHFNTKYSAEYTLCRHRCFYYRHHIRRQSAYLSRLPEFETQWSMAANRYTTALSLALDRINLGLHARQDSARCTWRAGLVFLAYLQRPLGDFYARCRSSRRRARLARLAVTGFTE